MAKFINVQNIIETNIEKQKEILQSTYTRFLESKPNFVTYFSRDPDQSFYDKGLENVEKDIGTYSPNKFTKIENLPVYGMEELINNLQYDEIGNNSEIEGEITIIPGTIKPVPQDFFVIDYLNKNILFEISNISEGFIQSKPIYKCQFFFKKLLDSLDEIKENVEKEAVFIYENVGSNNRPIVEKKDYLIINFAEKLIDSMIEKYSQYFFDKKLNAIVTTINNKFTYNKYLTHFLINNNVLSRKREIMSTIYLVDIFNHDNDPYFYPKYDKCIYGVLEKQDSDNLEYYNFIIKSFSDEVAYSQFSLYKKKYENKKNNIEFVKFKYKENSKPYNEYFSNDFFNRIISDTEYPRNDKIYAVNNMIIRYINNEFKLDERYLNTINRINFVPNYTSYFYLPIIIFILKKCIEGMEDKYDRRYFVLT